MSTCARARARVRVRASVRACKQCDPEQQREIGSTRNTTPALSCVCSTVSAGWVPCPSSGGSGRPLFTCALIPCRRHVATMLQPVAIRCTVAATRSGRAAVDRRRRRRLVWHWPAAGMALANGGVALAPRQRWHWPAAGMALARGSDGTGLRRGWHWPAAGMALARGRPAAAVSAHHVREGRPALRHPRRRAAEVHDHEDEREADGEGHARPARSAAQRKPMLKSRRRCGRGEPSPGADVARGEPSPGAEVGGVSPVPGADVAGASPVPAQMWPGRAQFRRRCGQGAPSAGLDVGGGEPSRARPARSGAAAAVRQGAGNRAALRCAALRCAALRWRWADGPRVGNQTNHSRAGGREACARALRMHALRWRAARAQQE
jgi:hypothetical protein